MIGIYHSKDLDGFASGTIIKLKYPDAKMVGYDYGQDFNAKVCNEPVIMADVSFPIEEMLQLAKDSGSQLTWIDHHISSIERYENYVENNGHFLTPFTKIGIAACELTWMYLFPDKDVPLAITLLSEYDVWKNQDIDKWNNIIMPFQYGMRLYCNSLDTFPIDVLTDESLVAKIIEEGKVVLRYQEKFNEQQCKRAAFEYKFQGYSALCLNVSGFNIDVFKCSYDESKHDIMLTFRFDGKGWYFSVYTKKETIDCSDIAKQNGGGGHRKAAGFYVEKITDIFNGLIY